MDTKHLVLIVLLSISAFSPSAAQENCDCDRYVSECTAKIQLDKAHAVADLQTSAKICTRVTFVIDRTPYTTVFSGGTMEEPVLTFQRERPQPARIRSCYVCATTDKAAKNPAEDVAAPKTLANYLQGSWFYGSDDIATKYTFDADGTGTSTHTGDFFAGTGHVTCSGEPSDFSCSDNWETTLPGNKPFTGRINYHGSRIDRGTFRFGDTVIFTRQ